MASGIIKRNYSLRVDEKTILYQLQNINTSYKGFKIRYNKAQFGYASLVIKITHRYGYTIAIVRATLDGTILYYDLNNLLIDNSSINTLSISDTSTSESDWAEVAITGGEWNNFVIEVVLPGVANYLNLVFEPISA